MTHDPSKARTANFFRTVVLAVVVPSVILSTPGPLRHAPPLIVFLLALAFPLGVGGYELAIKRHFNIFAGIGFLNTIITGGFGLFELPSRWLIAKETLVPLLLGILILVLVVKKVPIVKMLLRESIDFERIESAFRDKGLSREMLDNRLRRAAGWLTASFFISAAANFALASFTLSSNPGTEAFNKGLGSLTLFGFLFIALPLTAVFAIVMYRFFSFVEKETGLGLDELI